MENGTENFATYDQTFWLNSERNAVPVLSLMGVIPGGVYDGDLDSMQRINSHRYCTAWLMVTFKASGTTPEAFKVRINNSTTHV